MKRQLIILLVFFFIAGGSLLLEGCRKSKPPVFNTPVSFVVPPGFPAPVYNFQMNPLTEEGIQLGKKLFYDGRLSIDGNFPCSSCHQPEAAFTTMDHDRSHGYNNNHTLRNAPGLFNLAWYPVFNQDGSGKNLENVILKHITDPTEMAETMDHVITKLKADVVYTNMFRNAFGDEDINGDKIFKALSQFLVSMVSAESKYDRYLRGQAQFNFLEESGYQVFRTHCNSCHTEPLFTDFSFRNTGFEVDMNLKDHGLMRVTGNPSDSLKFRVPSLRNLEFTSHYAHDGRLNLPRHMIQHYRFGINQSPTLDQSLINGIQLTDQEENDLVLFLRALSDSAFLNNPKYRN